MPPPYRADQVGSLLRPATLMAARQEARAGRLSPEALRAQEDGAIREIVARQESIGLPAVTDGEFRRAYWHLDFLSQLEGVTLRENPGPKFGGTAEQPPIATVTGRVRYARPIMVEDFRFLHSVAHATPKLTIPSPSMLHLRGGRNAVSRQVYPELDAFWDDVARAYTQAIAAFAEAGCRYLQLDDVGFAYLADQRFRESCRRNGDDPEQLPQRYVETINAALAGRPSGLSVTLHTCHGNFRSAWATEGGYDAIAETLFQADIDGFFMEFDSDRSGGFEPLRFLPRDKQVVLGLVTTKVGQIESETEVLRRIEAATRFVPLENLCLSPQCGFASTEGGNKLSEEDQWRKLELIVRIARQVWGSER
ncbi:MAG TPA: 5-methyltetrahydropteroyltriglutamate--homocysteine S-methyltransferase [Steroidobacteraceae bacterium]|nr:5-methyltetrahydropteroyltriglutamate--homocysteine S-methyltransferase [Steroidobacteraceae bacterium]